MLETYDIQFFTSFPNDPNANEGRVAHIELRNKSSGHVDEGRICSEIEGVESRSFVPQDDKDRTIDIFGIYFPNGGKSEEAWQQKLVFYAEFAKYMDELRAK